MIAWWWCLHGDGCLVLMFAWWWLLGDDVCMAEATQSESACTTGQFCSFVKMADRRQNGVQKGLPQLSGAMHEPWRVPKTATRHFSSEIPKPRSPDLHPWRLNTLSLYILNLKLFPQVWEVRGLGLRVWFRGLAGLGLTLVVLNPSPARRLAQQGEGACACGHVLLLLSFRSLRVPFL